MFEHGSLSSRALVVLLLACALSTAHAANSPTRAAKGMVVSQNAIASEIGVQAMREGGSAVDAAVATAFALAVVHPTAGNIGGGGFLIHRPDEGAPVAYDFRERAPAAASPEMWLDENGDYDRQKHHSSHAAVGVPGTVAGLYFAWQDSGRLPWKRLVEPAIALARDGFVVTDGLARSINGTGMRRMAPYPASVAQFTRDGEPLQAGDVLRQPDLAGTLARIADAGPAGFYEGRTAELIVADMKANGGLITLEDLRNYEAVRRTPIEGTYRGYGVIGMPPPSSGGVTMVQILNVLEGYDLTGSGFGSARTIHLMTEAMRRGYANRARFLGDPEFNPEMPIDMLISKDYANGLRASIDADRASVSTPDSFEWPYESMETTHFSVVDADRNAVSLTYTLEYSYGSGIVVPGGGFLLNNEMGDFNAKPGLTDETGLIGTAPNLAEPGKRMLSSMSPTIVTRDGELFMVTGSPGGRTIINTTMQTIINVVDHGMQAQAAVDAGRIHHQWLPDELNYERQMFSPDTLALLEAWGHALDEDGNQGVAQVIVVDPESGVLEGGVDRRPPDGGAVGY
ncbi:MAG: gamma-glutamyltransferase [Pseudomonadales bacterium]|jgi:gamma-glutamyltranspeptidase/glutathione hydrolase|nr:gamma-glutamyltransferase [Pseudomonadales bacterium]